VKIENKKNHGRVKILGWSKKQHGTFSSDKLLADSKNVHVCMFGYHFQPLDKKSINR
jgi:hypothetical protein